MLSSAELLVRDAMLRSLPGRPPSKVAVVLIDEAAIRSEGRWPWSRAQIAHLVDRMFAAGAKGVALDLLLPEAREGDEGLAQALRQGPSVLAAGLDDSGAWLMPNRTLQGTQLGHVSFDLDRDGVVRRFSATKQMGGRVLPALSVAAARLGDARLPVPVGVILRPAFRTRPIPQISAAVLLGSDRLGSDRLGSDRLGSDRPGSELEAALRDRIVFLGTSAAGIGDRFVSPISQGGTPEPGVLVEAMSAEAILSKDLLRTAPPLLDALLVFGLALLGSFLLASPSRISPLIASPILLAPLMLSAGSLHLLDLELAPLAELSALLLVGTLVGGLRARQSRRAMHEAQRRIAELESLQSSLADLRQQDAEARRVVAHELKTPLTSVRGLAQLLAQFDLSGPERNRVAQMVVTETARLAEMVDALLDLERLRLRDFGQDARILDLSALCLARAGYLRAGTERNIEVDVEADLRVLGDQALLERVLENLVSNAFKFSPAGSPVRLSLRSEGSMARLEVEDQGPGVPVQERGAIFGRFARGSAQGMAPGLGLGLALVADVVAWHGGTVTVEAGAEGGSLFRVRLPLIPGNAD
ncbi:hypothetical protein GETHLI_34620 [Geothrix limicola]|uniref:histidine kinase n=1 Tax=Geothrix limicola TaxID=2927978 RepID=A0ABQ5QLW2_9BACT|nr:hypothetical protein GETHLI_34620 [Geothrix limicola]